jgi:ubiquinol-cytochrome c reductase cytochrome c subunit
LFLANCATCHGLNAEGTKVMVRRSSQASAPRPWTSRSARAVCRSPAPTSRRRADTVKFTEEQIAAIGAYVASLAPAPRSPTPRDGRPRVRAAVAKGGEIFRVNCAMCHNFAGSGGALTRGKYAPSLYGVTASTSTRR